MEGRLETAGDAWRGLERAPWDNSLLEMDIHLNLMNDMTQEGGGGRRGEEGNWMS